jgi:hypothetical protein
MTPDETAFWTGVADDPDLRAQAAGGFPVRSLVVGGVARRPHREIDAAQAAAFAARGMRCFVLTATVCGELSADQFGELLRLYRNDFADDSPDSGGERRIFVHGRRDESGADTRVVVAEMILWPDVGP